MFDNRKKNQLTLGLVHSPDDSQVKLHSRDKLLKTIINIEISSGEFICGEYIEQSKYLNQINS